MKPVGWDKALRCRLDRAAEVGKPWENSPVVRLLTSIVPEQHLDIAMMAWVMFFDSAPNWFYLPLEGLRLKRKFLPSINRRPVDMLNNPDLADELRFFMVEASALLL